MNRTSLTTARWELLNTPSNLSASTRSTLLEVLERKIGYPAPVLEDIPSDITPIAPLPDLSSPHKIAICVGHARSGDRGAVAFNGVNEQDYNTRLAQLMSGKLSINHEVISYYQGSSYGSAMRWLANKLKAEGFTMAIELHFNSFSDPKVGGFEYLFWHKSKRGVKVAEVFQRNHNVDYPHKSNRGAKPLGDQAHERGVLFCSLLHCPSIILEPFFGTNRIDAESYMSPAGQVELAQFNVKCLEDACRKIAA